MTIRGGPLKSVNFGFTCFWLTCGWVTLLQCVQPYYSGLIYHAESLPAPPQRRVASHGPFEKWRSGICQLDSPEVRLYLTSYNLVVFAGCRGPWRSTAAWRA
ncbi:hypothetical protein C8R46DRAFT_1060514 [Mycena filopes]|nr:hypothetical protein C8R46DRAFT_1060514 [Mycena filopes]